MRLNRARLSMVVLLGTAALSLIGVSRTRGQTVASIDPIDLRDRGFALASTGDDAAAVDVLRQAVSVNPDDPYLWRALGRACARLGRHSEATAALAQAYHMGVFSPGNAALEVARVRVAAGDREDALRWIERALEGRRCCRNDLLSDKSFEVLRDDPSFRQLAAAPEAGLERDARWRADLAFLVEEARRMHVGPDRPAHSEAFAGRVRQIQAGIPTWSDTRIAVELRGLVVMLGDGHSSLSVVGESTNAGKLPIDLYQFEEGVFVVDSPTRADLVGRQVLRIGGRPVLDVLEDLGRFVPRDNPQGLRAAASWVLVTVPYLDAIGVVEDDGRVRFEVAGHDGRSDQVLLKGDSWRASPRLPPPPGVRDVPRYLRAGPPFWTERLGKADALYLDFSAVADGPKESLEAFGRRLKNELARDRVRTLIVDVRMNGGGNTFLFNQLVRTLVHFEQNGDDHRLFVLIGRHTFSAAQNFISVLDRWTDATFVGEPSGSRPNFTGESSPVTLPHSRLRGTISTRNHQNVDWEDRRLWIAPDIPVPPTAADYFAGRDAALDAVLARLGRGQGGR